MSTLILAILFAAIILIVAMVYALSLKRPHQNKPNLQTVPYVAKYEPWPYYLKRCMTEPEQVTFHRLVAALPDHHVLAQVGLSQLLGVKSGANFAEWFNKINRMTVDFVVCDKSATIKHVIELDDSTHKRADRVAADLRKDRALKDAGVTTVRWNVSNIPTVEEMTKILSGQSIDVPAVIEEKTFSSV